MGRFKSTLLLTLAMSTVFAMSAFAAESGTVVQSSDWAAIISAMTAQISVSTVVEVIATTITTGIGLVFMWWGGRKAVRALMSAFRKGKLSV